MEDYSFIDKELWVQSSAVLLCCGTGQDTLSASLQSTLLNNESHIEHQFEVCSCSYELYKQNDI